MILDLLQRHCSAATLPDCAPANPTHEIASSAPPFTSNKPQYCLILHHSPRLLHCVPLRSQQNCHPPAHGCQALAFAAPDRGRRPTPVPDGRFFGFIWKSQTTALPAHKIGIIQGLLPVESSQITARLFSGSAGFQDHHGADPKRRVKSPHATSVSSATVSVSTCPSSIPLCGRECWGQHFCLHRTGWDRVHAANAHPGDC